MEYENQCVGGDFIFKMFKKIPHLAIKEKLIERIKRENFFLV